MICVHLAALLSPHSLLGRLIAPENHHFPAYSYLSTPISTLADAGICAILTTHFGKWLISAIS